MNELIYVKYKRKSSEQKERQAPSLDRQEIECSNYQKQAGIYVYEKFDFAESASAFIPNNRPKFDEMMALIESKQVNAILTWSPDRLCRNPREGGNILQLLQDGILKEIRTASGDIYTSQSDLLVLQIHFGMANQYSRNLSRNVKSGLVRKCERGEYPRPAPIGFVGCGLRGQRNIRPHKFESKIIQQINERAATSQYSINDLRLYAFKEGLRTKKGKPLSKSHIYVILQNPLYYGYFYQNGQLYKGSYKPIITKKLFDQVQAALRNRSKPKNTDWDDMNTWNRIANCAYCNCMITTSHKTKHYKRTNRTVTYDYQHCTKRRGNCLQKPITKAEFETALIENVNRITLDKEVWSLGIKLVKEKYKNEANDRTVRHKHFEGQYHTIQKRINGLIAMRADGELSKTEFMIQKNELLKEQARYDGLIRDTKVAALSWFDLTEKFLDTAFEAKDIMLNGSPPEKRELILSLGENLFLKDGKIDFRFRKPYDILLKPDFRTNVLGG